MARIANFGPVRQELAKLGVSAAAINALEQGFNGGVAAPDGAVTDADIAALETEVADVRTIAEEALSSADAAPLLGPVSQGFSGLYSDLLSIPAPIDAIDNLTPAADKLAYYTGATTAALTDLTSFGRSLIDDANASAARTTLGLVIGTDVQAFDADLSALAALSGTNTIYYRSAANTWSAVTIGTNLTFSGGTLSSTGGGTPGGSSGQIQYNNAGAFGGFTASGDVTVNTGTGVMTIANDAVTYAKLQNVSATSRVLGRKTAGSGDAEELTLSEVLDFVGSAAQGDILYRGSSSWARLPAGTLGQVLQTNGPSSNPGWVTPTGGVVTTGLPATIPDLVYWFESDNILNTSGYGVPVLQNRTPWGYAASAVPIAGSTGATISTTLNSLPALLFPGTANGRYANLSPLNSIPSQGGTYFAILKPTSLAAIGTIIGGAASSLQFRVETTGKLNLLKTNVASIGQSTTTLSAGTWYQVNATFLPSSGAYAFRVAQAGGGSGTNIQSITGVNSAIGYNPVTSGEDLSASVAAVLIYARVLSSIEIAAVEAYLNAKWAV